MEVGEGAASCDEGDGGLMMCVFYVWVGVVGQEEFKQSEVFRGCCLAFLLMVFWSGTGKGIVGRAGGRGEEGGGGLGERGGGVKEEKCWIHNRLIEIHVPSPHF